MVPFLGLLFTADAVMSGLAGQQRAKMSAPALLVPGVLALVLLCNSGLALCDASIIRMLARCKLQEWTMSTRPSVGTWVWAPLLHLPN